jgi:peptidyl-prolyl cis-trans isomerase SurA
MHILSLILLGVLALPAPPFAETKAKTAVSRTTAGMSVTPELGKRTEQDRVVAVINNQVIPLSYLQARTRLTIRELGLKAPTPQAAQSLQRRTLLQLVDEELQRQFAMQTGISPTAANIANVQKTLTEALGGPAAFTAYASGMNQTVQARLAAEARWQGILARAVSPRVQVGTSEIDQLITNLSRNRGTTERNLSLIVLNVGSPDDDAAQKAKLDTIMKALDEGADFAAQARAFSDDKSAANGGNIGWYANGQLNPELEDALNQLEKGERSGPIRTPEGWFVVKLNDTRSLPPITTALVAQKQLYMLGLPQPSSSTTAVDALLAKATKAIATPSDVLSYFAQRQFAETFPNSQDLGWVELPGLQPQVQAAVSTTAVGRWSAPLTLVASGNQPTRRVQLYVAGARQAIPQELAELRARVTQRMTETRTEQEARRFMRELRARAFVDVRL